MIAIISGEIQHTKKSSTDKWLSDLQDIFKKKGQYPGAWDQCKGNKFQVSDQGEEALRTAIHILSCIKSYPHLEVKMGIGIGEPLGKKKEDEHKVALKASNQQFKKVLGSKKRWGFQSPWPDFDETMNLLLQLSSMAVNDWTVKVAQTVKMAMEHPTLDQRELGKKLGIRQSSVSERLSRAKLDELLEVDDFFQRRLPHQL